MPGGTKPKTSQNSLNVKTKSIRALARVDENTEKSDDTVLWLKFIYHNLTRSVQKERKIYQSSFRTKLKMHHHHTRLLPI